MTTTCTRAFADKAQLFNILDLHRYDIDEECEESKKKVREAWCIAASDLKSRNSDEKEIMRVNNARAFLLDQESRENYVNALILYDIHDGM